MVFLFLKISYGIMMKKIIKEDILKVLNNIIEDGFITSEQVDIDLSELGVNSIMYIRIIVELEELYDCIIPDKYLLLGEMNTVNKIMDVLKKCELEIIEENKEQS